MINPQTLDLKTQAILDKQLPFTFDYESALDLLDDLEYEASRLEFKLESSFGAKVTTRNFIDLAMIKYPWWKPELFTDKGNPAMTDEALELMSFDESDLMRDYNVLVKILGYLRSWEAKRIDSRLGHTCKASGASTSRVSHSNPNLGQIPSPKGRALKKDLGMKCRGFFGVEPGFKQLGIDVSGLELRMLAHYLYRFDGGAYAREVESGDIHRFNQVAAGLDTRDMAKEFIFSWLYGAGLPLLAKKLFLNTTDEAKIISDNFLSNTAGLSDLKNALQVATSRGYLKTITGRQIKCDSAHKSLNYLLQSAGAEVTKIWMCMFHRAMSDQGFVYGKHWYQMIYVFDELQIAVSDDIDSDLVGGIAVKSMQAAADYCNLNINLTGEYKLGMNWAETH